MKKQLFIYNNITPNIDGGLHYLQSPFGLFYTLNNYLLKTIDANNYRINALVCQLSGVLKEATYIIDVEYEGEAIESDDNIKYFKCYYVDKIVTQSNMTILNLSVDYWGTYINDASIEKFNIRRCNRNIDKGSFDAIKDTIVESVAQVLDYVPLEGDATDYDYIKTYDDDYMAIVFFASCVVSRNLTGTEKTTAILPLACTLKSLRELCTQEIQERYGSVEIASKIISGITGLQSAYEFITQDVEVLKAYIVPNHAINPSNYYYEFKTKNQATGASSETTFKAYILNASRYIKYFNLSNININKKYYAGVINDGLELTNFTKNNYITYTYEINHDGINVIVAQGDKMKDISSHFEVALIGSSIAQDALQTIGNSCKAIATSITIATSQSATGFFKSLFNEAGNFLTNKPQASGTLGNSDASIVYNWTNIDYRKVIVPYYLTLYTSLINEKKNARYNGANFNIILESGGLFQNLEDISLDYNLLGEGLKNYTYIQGEAIVKNVPTEAREVLQNKLARGVYYE